MVDQILSAYSTPDILKSYFNRVKEGKLTREENPKSHFCVYFAAYDPKKGHVFVGHHIKSNDWLFTGGHSDLVDGKIEPFEVTRDREIIEEWGNMPIFDHNLPPSLITITEINSPKVKCKKHFDIWFFIPLDEENFNFDKDKLAKEYYEIFWMDIYEARIRTSCPSTIIALDYIEKNLMGRVKEGRKED